MLILPPQEQKTRGVHQMIFFEAGIFLLMITGVMGLIVKTYEWRQDVLYGPYLRRDDQRDIR